MSEYSQKELAEFLGHFDHIDYGRDYKMEVAHFFSENIDKYELFDAYHKFYDEQEIKNHLECYNQIRLIIFKKCLEEVKYKIIEAVENMDIWAYEQFKQFVDTVIKTLFIGYDEFIQYEKDYESIIKSYITYKGSNNKKRVDLSTFEMYKKYGIDDEDDVNKQSIEYLLYYIDSACIASPKWKKEFTFDQLKFIDMYRTYFLYKTPVVDFIDETSNPQFTIEMDYACDYSPEFYSLIFQLYLMGNNKDIKANTIKNAILDYDDPKETYMNLILKLWEWAQREKGGASIPPTSLKKFCCDVLKVVCDNNSYARYSSRDFINDRAGWELLRKANENIKSSYTSLNQD